MANTSFTKKPISQDLQSAPSLPTSGTEAPTNFVRKPKLISRGRKRDIPEGLWTKCPKCAVMVFDKELDENFKVCPQCGHHFPMSARERIHSLVETCTFEEIDADLVSVDILGFTGTASYTAKLEEYQRATGLKDAIVTGVCKIGPHLCGLGVMDFAFLGGSMGSVVGEKVTHLVEICTDRELPLILISSSGGARMYEGLFSLMQMAKTCGALAYHARAGLPFISVLTHPTTAGVMASFATVGDLILAEPGAMIGFAGPRVIKDTTQSELPPGFQTAEFLLDHGLIDAIVPRPELRSKLITYLTYLTAHRRRTAPIP
ncbi:MAG: acetyl-CoA carboxylase, carboxyltransferase subunit beta [Limisphaera sp.]|nr:acetyl-CoA carboxylase, carboxyltransferase subunit beta [Limisphaera sp.]